MELLEWLHLLNGLELNQSQASLNVANSLFLAYTILALVTKKVAPLAAFFMCVLLVDNTVLLVIKEYQIYMLMCVIYSYVFIGLDNTKSKISCGIIALSTIILAFDARLYGKNGFYGASETFIYNNIEYIALFVNLLFIASFISYKRIRNALQSFFNIIACFSGNSACFFICWYNSIKQSKER